MFKKFLGSAAIYAIANIVNASIPFLMLPVLTRLLSPTDYGLVAMFATTITVLGAFTGLNVHGAISIRYFQQDKFHLPSYIKTSLGVLAVSTALIVFLLWLGAAPLESLTHLPKEWLLLATLVSGTQFIIQIQLAVWQAENKPLQYGTLKITQSLIDASLSLYLILLAGYFWEGRTGGQALAVGLFALISLVTLYRGGWLKGKLNSGHAENLLRFGLPLVPHTIGGLLIALMDRYIVSNVLGLADAGVYMAGLQLGMAMGLVADAFVKAFGPWLNKQLTLNTIEAEKRIVGAVYLSFFLFAILGYVIYAATLLVFDLALSQNYAKAKVVLPFFIAGNVFLGMYYAIVGLIFFSSQTYRISKITLAIGIFSVPCTYFLLKSWGIAGAAASYAISQFLIFVLAWRESTKVFSLPWKDVRQCMAFLTVRH